MNYHLFIDESGDPSLTNVNPIFPVFVLLGYLIEEKEYVKVCEKIDNLKTEIFGSRNVIFHSRDIRKCEGPFVKLFDLQVKEIFYKKLNSILDEADFKIIAVGIKKQEYIEKYGKISDDPYEISLSFLLERTVMEVSGNGNKIYTKIESRGKKEDEIIQKRYNKLLDVGSGHIAPDKFKKVLEKVEFRKKKENDCGLQLADLCAYPVARNIVNPNEPYPPFDVVSKKFRRNPNGNHIGYGLKIFP